MWWSLESTDSERGTSALSLMLINDARSHEPLSGRLFS